VKSKSLRTDIHSWLKTYKAYRRPEILKCYNTYNTVNRDVGSTMY